MIRKIKQMFCKHDFKKPDMFLKAIYPNQLICVKCLKLVHIKDIIFM